MLAKRKEGKRMKMPFLGMNLKRLDAAILQKKDEEKRRKLIDCMMIVSNLNKTHEFLFSNNINFTCMIA